MIRQNNRSFLAYLVIVGVVIVKVLFTPNDFLHLFLSKAKASPHQEEFSSHPSSYTNLLSLRTSAHDHGQSNLSVVASTLPKQGLTSNNSSSTRPSRLFTCGYGIQALQQSIFPEFNETLVYGRRYQTYPEDFLFFGMHGFCARLFGPQKITHRYVRSHFQGKALFCNGEAFGDILENTTTHNHNVFQIGWVPPHRINDPQDGHHYLPIYFVAVSYLQHFSNYSLLERRPPPKQQERSAVIYMNSHCVSFREEAAVRLSKLLAVHHGGACRGTRRPQAIPNLYRVPDDPGSMPTNYWENMEYFRKYRYCLVMENTNTSGYVTEKLLVALLSGACVPIYYGTREVYKLFSSEAFIFYNVDNPQPALDQLKYLETNETAYREMQTAPILANGQETLETHFSLVDDIGKGVLRRKIRNMMGLSSSTDN